LMAAGPTIGDVVAAETAAPKNGVLESTDKVAITWGVTSASGVASQTLTIDGKKVTTINGPFGGRYYSCTIGKLTAGSHVYTITATDSRGVSSSSTGTIAVVAPPPPSISNVVAAEAGASKNGTIEPGEKVVITWAATSASGIASQTMTVDGKKMSTIKGPYSGRYYSCAVGSFAAGSHTYTVKSTDSKGVSSTYNGSIVVVDPAALQTGTLTITTPGTLLDSGLTKIGEGTITLNPSTPVHIGETINQGSGTTLIGVGDGSTTTIYSGGTLNLSCGTGGTVTLSGETVNLNGGTFGNLKVNNGLTTTTGGVSVVLGTGLADGLKVAASTAAVATPDTISPAQLSTLVVAAAERLCTQAGQSLGSALANVTFAVASLPDGLLTAVVGNTIFIDNDAAGYGWFVDATPGDDAEFNDVAGAHWLAAKADSAASGRMDALTAVMHEMSHLLGYQDAADGLMQATLPLGVRRTLDVSSGHTS
jgi:hypothetical protein